MKSSVTNPATPISDVPTYAVWYGILSTFGFFDLFGLADAERLN